MYVLNARAQALERLDVARSRQLEANAQQLKDLEAVLHRIEERLPVEDADVLEAMHLVKQVQTQLLDCQSQAQASANSDLASHLPPEMLAGMQEEARESGRVCKAYEVIQDDTVESPSIWCSNPCKKSK